MIIVVYEQKCPEKASLVEGVMTTYAGEELESFPKVCKFYGWPPAPWEERPPDNLESDKENLAAREESVRLKIWNELTEAVAEKISISMKDAEFRRAMERAPLSERGKVAEVRDRQESAAVG